MVQAWDLLSHKQWYQHVTLRVNAPFGSDLHGWTQVINAMLAGGAYVLSSFMPLATAFSLWCFILPIISQFVAAYGMLWAIKKMNPSPFQQLFIVLAFLCNPFLSSLYLPLRVDYDFLLISISIFYWGCLLRAIDDTSKKWLIISAILAGLGSWTSISFMIMVFIGLLYLIKLSLIEKRLNSSILTPFLVVLCLIMAVAIRLEHRYFFTITHDTVSIVHLTFFFFLLLGFMAYRALHSFPVLIKILFSLVTPGFIFWIMDTLFPGFYRGPYAQADPYLLQNFFPALSEFHSPFAIDNAIALSLLSYFIIGSGFFYYLYLSRKECPYNPALALLAWAATITTLLTACMYRWNGFASPLNLLLVSFFVASMGAKKIAVSIKVFFLLGMVFLPQLILGLAKDTLPPAHQECQTQFHQMLTDGFLENPAYQRDSILFAHSNYGPLLLHATHFSIIASNDHHNPQGVRDSFTFFKADETTAQQIAAKRNIDLFLLCPSEHALQFHPEKSAWLEPLNLPKKYSQWQLYRRLS